MAVVGMDLAQATSALVKVASRYVDPSLSGLVTEVASLAYSDPQAMRSRACELLASVPAGRPRAEVGRAVWALALATARCPGEAAVTVELGDAVSGLASAMPRLTPTVRELIDAARALADRSLRRRPADLRGAASLAYRAASEVLASATSSPAEASWAGCLLFAAADLMRCR